MRGATPTCALWLVLAACGAGREDPAPVAPPPAIEPAEPEPSRPEPAEPEPAESEPSRPEPTDTPEPLRAVDGTIIELPGPDDVPPSRFEGRTIAQTMSFLGAGWLTRSERDAEEDTTTLHRELGLRPGQTACDVGAGNGYHTIRMAQAVGPSGRVLAVDIQPQMLALLRANVDEAGLHNVETIEARPGDPRLPPSTCDLILLVDVYHELAWPEPMLAAFRRALTPTGRVALVEYRAEDPDVPIKRLHKMSAEQIEREFGPRGFTRVGRFDGLPWQHLVFYARDPGPDPG